MNKSDSTITLKFECKEFQWESGKSLLQMLELMGFVKEVFPLHGMLASIFHKITSTYARTMTILEFSFIDEIKRKQLLRSWALNCWDFTRQPIDEIYAYFGTKVYTYVLLAAF